MYICIHIQKGKNCAGIKLDRSENDFVDIFNNELFLTYA